MAKKKIVFTGSPIARYNLAYHAGEVAELDEATAKQLIEDSIALAYDGDKKPGFVYADIAAAKKNLAKGKAKGGKATEEKEADPAENKTEDPNPNPTEDAEKK